MTNYSMQQGRRRNDKIKFIKRFILVLAVIYSIGLLFQYWSKKEEVLNASFDKCLASYKNTSAGDYETYMKACMK